ncbi:hypothetical protein D3C73_1155850 [compost metagenome]
MRLALAGGFPRLFAQAHQILDAGVGELDLLNVALGHVAGELMDLAGSLGAFEGLIVQQGKGPAHAFSERQVLPGEPFLRQ